LVGFCLTQRVKTLGFGALKFLYTRLRGAAFQAA
jgi:hypothetical protein